MHACRENPSTLRVRRSSHSERLQVGVTVGVFIDVIFNSAATRVHGVAAEQAGRGARSPVAALHNASGSGGGSLSSSPPPSPPLHPVNNSDTSKITARLRMSLFLLGRWSTGNRVRWASSPNLARMVPHDKFNRGNG